LTKYKSKVQEIEGVFQIKIDVPWAVKFVCLYIFELDGKTVLIDAGLDMGSWSRYFFAALKEIGMTINNIDYCIITHHHLDHIGLTRKLKLKNPNLKVIMHDITDRVLKWETDKANKEEIENEAIDISMQMKKYGLSEEERKMLIQFFTYWPNMRKYQKPDVLLHDGDEILNGLNIIWTPGHSFGHICIFNAKTQFLFSGDHILSKITPHIGNYIIPAYISEDYKDYDFNNILKHYLSSLDKIDRLNSKIIFPAHQEIIYNPHERILEIKKHHENRLSEISSMIKDNPLTPYRISKLHFGEDLDEINGFMALSEVLGHLLYLENEGKVQKIEKNGNLYYFN
jgi:glyoxylase-like metal-dependent hydrolase (beta-lactamase superfamily II)